MLHLNLGSPETSIGPAGKFSVRRSSVELWIYPDRTPIPLGTIPISVPEVGNVDDAADLVELCLLGRKPFFELFDITYQESKQRVVFRPSSKPAPKFGPPQKPSKK